jgi:hypothetical protein
MLSLIGRIGLRTNFRQALKVLSFRRRYQVRYLVIGDSHASFLVHNRVLANQGYEGMWALWCGPKLLFSIGRDGLRLGNDMMRTIRFMKATHTLFCFGEIDVRTRHNLLNSEKDVQRITNSYLKSLKKFSDKYSLKSRVVLEPPPPFFFRDLIDVSSDDEYPIRGNPEDRLLAHNLLARELKLLSINYGFIFIPFPEVLKEASGYFSDKYSHDTCHANKAANDIWKLQIKSVLCNN